MRALVAEDHPQLRCFHVEALESLGYSVTTASNGWEAKRALNQDYDLVFLDNRMLTGPRGSELLQDYREAGHKSPVVLCTADPLGDWASRFGAAFHDKIGTPNYAALIAEAQRLVGVTA